MGGTGVIDNFLGVFTSYIDSGFGLLGGEVAFIATTLIVFGLFAVHVWLPAGRRRLVDIVPGILFTLIAWLAGSTMFAAYLDNFSSYVTTYAGLASIMIAVVFLYIVSAIFILGGELNAAISRYFDARARVAG